MATSLPPNVAPTVLSKFDARWHPPPRIIKHRQSSLFFCRLLRICIALILFGLATANLACQPTISPPDESTTEKEWTGSSGDIAFVQFNGSDLLAKITETPAFVELPTLPAHLTATPFTLIEPTSTPNPTATPTRLIFYAPTPTQTPWPTSTLIPTATTTPLPTPTTAATATDTPMPTPTLEAGIKYVVIISIDGLRPDALFLADTPNIDRLKDRGAYSATAQTVKMSVTMPSHASMLSGMIPEKHGFLWGQPYIGWPGMTGPTLFNVARDAGLSTALIAGKEKFSYLHLPNSLDMAFYEEVHDTEVKAQAVKFIESGLSEVLFIHFPDVDRVGHAYGWMSPNQLDAIRFVDSLIGEIILTLENEGYLANTLLILTSDHGGHGFGHGDDSPLDRTIPWLAAGPGVPANVTLTRHIDTFDTAATALQALNLPIPATWDGEPVMEIFE